MFINQEFYKNAGLTVPTRLFEIMTDTLYFVKDIDGRFVCANSNFISHFHLDSEHQVKSMRECTDYEIMPEPSAQRVRNDDALIRAGTLKFDNQLELVPDANKKIAWFITTKIPLLDLQGKIVGIEGFVRDLHLAADGVEPLNEFSECVKFIESNLGSTPSIPDLAKRTNMSVSQFERKFKSRFGDSPLKFIKRLKIDVACSALAGGQPISEVASELGFTDQSYFTKEFKRITGTTPKQYARSSKAVAVG